MAMKDAGHPGKGAKAPLPPYVADFLATSDGLALVKAFMQIDHSALRRSIVRSSRKSSAT